MRARHTHPSPHTPNNPHDYPILDPHRILPLRCSSVRWFLPESDRQTDRRTDGRLFSRIRRNRPHVLYRFLPEPNYHQHDLRHRRHNFSLSTKTDDRNFIIRQLFSESYWCIVAMTIVYLYISYLNVHSCGLSNCSIKLYYYYYYYCMMLMIVFHVAFDYCSNRQSTGIRFLSIGRQCDSLGLHSLSIGLVFV